MYRDVKNSIEKLSRKIVDIDAAVRREKRGMTAEENRLRNEILDHISELQQQLPQRSLTGQSSSYNRSDGPFPSFGEQLRSVMMAAIPGHEVDPKLYQIRDATGLSETVPSDAGFLVQADFSAELLQEVFATGLLAPLCRRIQIGNNSNRILIPGIDETSRATGSRWGGIQSYWEDEAAEKTASKPKFRKIELILKKLIGLCYATDELLDDAPALERTIREGFASEFGFMIDDAIINGGGAGQPLGILNSKCLVTVDKEKGQSSSTTHGAIMFENILSLYSRIIQGSYATCVWLINQTVLPALYQMSMAVGTGGVPVFIPANQIAGQPFNSLMGRPIMVVEQCATLGTVGDIILADFKNGYIIAEKGDVKADLSIHVRLKKLTPHTVMYVENSVNSGEPHKLGNPEPSLSEKTASAMSMMLYGQEGATTIPYGSISQANGDGSAEHPMAKDDYIVCSARKLAAVLQ